MIQIEGYSIEQYPKQNTIIIKLPQTLGTCTSTVGAIAYRREVLNDDELATFLHLIRTYFEKEQNEWLKT